MQELRLPLRALAIAACATIAFAIGSFLCRFGEGVASDAAIGFALFCVVPLLLPEGRAFFFRQMDWKITAIIITNALAILISLLVYAMGFGREPDKFFGAVFAAWIGGVAFFTLVGLVVAIVSLVKPEQESFETRARILFRRETGAHIDYIIEHFKKQFEHYTETASNKIVLLAYETGTKRYRVAIEHIGILRGYIDDIQSTYGITLKYEQITPPPLNGADNRLVYLRLNDTPKTIAPNTSATSIEQAFQATLEPGRACEVRHRLEVWIQSETEEIEFSPVRFSQLVNLEIENHLPLEVRVTAAFHPDYLNGVLPPILPGDIRKVRSFKDMRPEMPVYKLVLHEP